MEAAAAINPPAVPGKAPIRVAAICGSLRKGSCNRGLIRAAIEISNESIPGMIIEYIDTSSLPLLNTDLEVNGTFPPEVEAFRDKIRQADSVLLASPDYNYSVSAPLKNALDWGSRPPNAWADKAAALVSAAGGSGGALQQYHVRQIGVFLNLHFINKPEFYLRRPWVPPQKCDGNGNLIDGEVRERLKEVLLSLYAFTLRLQGGQV